MKAAKIAAYVLSAMMLFFSILLFFDGRQNLITLLVGNVFFFYVFRIPYYIIKGYKGKSDSQLPANGQGVDIPNA